MKREAIKKLEEWRKSPRRKPLLLLGARQVGKTWLAREFGKEQYQWVAYVRFDKSSAMREAFERSSDVKRLLEDIQLICGVEVRPGETLIILDEIQECSAALSSLKFFCEEAPEYHIIAAGSLPGVELHRSIGFPVGKVDRVMLYPLTFTEFLTATGHERYAELLRKRDWETITRFQDVYENLLRNYFYIGGMPEAVKAYLETGQFVQVRKVQMGLLADYRADFSRHAPESEVVRLCDVWDSIPTQLADNKRFVLADIVRGAKSSTYRAPITWLQEAGLLHAAYNVRQPQLPLSGYRDEQFRLFPLDVGLLAAQAGLPSAVLVEKNAVFGQFKGALTEQYVFQQLLAECEQQPYFWLAEKAQAEIDFLLETEQGVVPLEAKAELNLRAKSLRSYCKRYNPEKIARTSMHSYGVSSYAYSDTDGTARSCSLLDIPLFAISQLPAELLR